MRHLRKCGDCEVILPPIGRPGAHRRPVNPVHSRLFPPPIGETHLRMEDAVMEKTPRVLLGISVVGLVLAAGVVCEGAGGPTAKVVGWRGNWTGLYPEADPVLEWGRKSLGIAGHLRISADRPKGEGPGDARPVRNHWPKEWLVIGPFEGPAGHPKAGERLDQDFLGDETKAQPTGGDKVGKAAWKRLVIPEEAMPPYERGEVAGAVTLRWVRFQEVLDGLKQNRERSVCYAHTYLYAEKAGEVEIIVDHGYGLKVRVNGEEVYKEVEGKGGLSAYQHLGKYRATYAIYVSPRIRIKLRKGWNRLLLKMTPRKWLSPYFFHFNLRIVDPPGTPYEDRNILWTAPVYDRSNATPILVKDRIFVMAEPDQILCLDKRTGKQLWTRFLTRYHATPPAERLANPAFREKVEPLARKLPEATTLEERMALRKEIDAALVAIDAKRYKLKWDGHMQAHFRAVGWTVPTPVSDGNFVYVWCGNGVAACYDLEGNTRWIRRVNPGKLYYPASPTVIDGKLIVFASGGFNMVALDAATGAEVWRQPNVDKSLASMIPARIKGVSVVISQQADVVRVADGRLLFERPIKGGGDSGWAPSVCFNNVIYQPYYGTTLMLLDFNDTDVTKDQWTCRRTDIGSGAISKNSKGQWIDRWTCGSPLIHEDIYYNIDIFGTLYAVDLKTRKPLYRVELSRDFNSLCHYNAVGVAASVTLGGTHLFVMDNQGTCVVFKPGREFRKVAVNRIETTARRVWPMRPQEEIGYSPPLFEGTRMYLRGEQYFYCIGR